MNLVLLFDEDWQDEAGRVRLTGRRLAYVRDVHRAREGDTLLVGRVGGLTGEGRITRLDESVLEMEVQLECEPPPSLDVTLSLALPRPPVLRRVLIAATSMGVKRIVLHHAAAVEKSFWQSHALQPEAIRDQLVLGLEQARDTRLPEVLLRRRFRPFVEDELPGLLAGGTGWVAQPAGVVVSVDGAPCPSLIAVGPEGGWSDFELDHLLGAGLKAVSLGLRPLRVETAVPALLARLL